VRPLDLPAYDCSAHYHWAGLDFIIDREGVAYFLEANRSSHMLYEYVNTFNSFEPFRRTAALMNQTPGPPCLLWRRQDAAEDGSVENACWIGSCLTRFLEREPVIAFVEDLPKASGEVVSRDGKRIQPGSIFRWWYPLSWSFETSGVRVINPNCVWVAVRDKLDSYATLSRAKGFRVPKSFAVESSTEAVALIAHHRNIFAQGFVVKPRTGFGGHGVQVGSSDETPIHFAGKYMLSERITPHLSRGHYWDVRVFVMAGKFVGGLVRLSAGPVTNIFQGGHVRPITDELAALLEPAALEAVTLLDRAAAVILAQPQSIESPLTEVVW
jgi:Sugar-transfer associated ATP-grasp